MWATRLEAAAAEGEGDSHRDIMVENPNHSDKNRAVLKLISSTFDENTKEAIKMFEGINEDYNEERKKGKKGSL